VKVKFANSPKARLRPPTVPAPADGMNDGKFQHSSTDTPSRVVIAVRFRDGVVMLERVGEGHREGSETEKLAAKYGVDATSRISERNLMVLMELIRKINGEKAGSVADEL